MLISRARNARALNAAGVNTDAQDALCRQDVRPVDLCRVVEDQRMLPLVRVIAVERLVRADTARVASGCAPSGCRSTRTR